MRRASTTTMLLLVLAACGSADDGGDDGDLSDAGRRAVVGTITDGDTFRTTGDERVRIIGIDTPEPQEHECFAAAATERITELIPPGTEVLLVLDVDPEDRFGRTLAYVHRASDGLDVGLALAAEGFAAQLTIAPNVDRADEIGDAVEDARDERRGLWSAC